MSLLVETSSYMECYSDDIVRCIFLYFNEALRDMCKLLNESLWMKSGLRTHLSQNYNAVLSVISISSLFLNIYSHLIIILLFLLANPSHITKNRAHFIHFLRVFSGLQQAIFSETKCIVINGLLKSLIDQHLYFMKCGLRLLNKREFLNQCGIHKLLCFWNERLLAGFPPSGAFQ